MCYHVKPHYKQSNKAERRKQNLGIRLFLKPPSKHKSSKPNYGLIRLKITLKTSFIPHKDKLDVGGTEEMTHWFKNTCCSCKVPGFKLLVASNHLESPAPWGGGGLFGALPWLLWEAGIPMTHIHAWRQSTQTRKKKKKVNLRKKKEIKAIE